MTGIEPQISHIPGECLNHKTIAQFLANINMSFKILNVPTKQVTQSEMPTKIWNISQKQVSEADMPHKIWNNLKKQVSNCVMLHKGISQGLDRVLCKGPLVCSLGSYFKSYLGILHVVSLWFFPGKFHEAPMLLCKALLWVSHEAPFKYVPWKPFRGAL